MDGCFAYVRGSSVFSWLCLYLFYLSSERVITVVTVVIRVMNRPSITRVIALRWEAGFKINGASSALINRSNLAVPFTPTFSRDSGYLILDLITAKLKEMLPTQFSGSG